MDGFLSLYSFFFPLIPTEKKRNPAKHLIFYFYFIFANIRVGKHKCISSLIFLLLSKKYICVCLRINKMCLWIITLKWFGIFQTLLFELGVRVCVRFAFINIIWHAFALTIQKF